MTNNSNSLLMGGIVGVAFRYRGLLDDFRVYGSALTPTEVASIY